MVKAAELLPPETKVIPAMAASVSTPAPALSDSCRVLSSTAVSSTSTSVTVIAFPFAEENTVLLPTVVNAEPGAVVTGASLTGLTAMVTVAGAALSTVPSLAR